MKKGEAMQALRAAILSDCNLCFRGKSAYLQTALADNKDNFTQREQIPIRDLKEFLEYFVVEVLRPLGVQPCAGHPRVNPHSHKSKAGEWLPSVELKTHACKLNTELYYEYYPSGKKAIPEDFTPTSLFLAWFFMFDGCSAWVSSGGPGIDMFLCTEGFDLHSIELFEEQLHKLGIRTGRNYKKGIKDGSGIEIAILQDSVDHFTSIVDPYIIPPYRYKVKYRGSCPPELVRKYREHYKKNSIEYYGELGSTKREHYNESVRNRHGKRKAQNAAAQTAEEEGRAAQNQRFLSGLRAKLRGG